MARELRRWHNPPVALDLHLAVTWALVGVIWVVQLVLYPAFARVPAAAFPEYHAHHTRAITWVVAPLMLLEVATAAWLLARGFRAPWFLSSLLPLAVNWASTAFVQVPLHGRLARAFDAEAHRRLVGTNWVRTAAWTARGLCLLAG